MCLELFVIFTAELRLCFFPWCSHRAKSFDLTFMSTIVIVVCAHCSFDAQRTCSSVAHFAPLLSPSFGGVSLRHLVRPCRHFSVCWTLATVLWWPTCFYLLVCYYLAPSFRPFSCSGSRLFLSQVPSLELGPFFGSLPLSLQPVEGYLHCACLLV